MFPWAVRMSVALAWLAGQSLARSGTGEYEIKAAFLYNFAKFVEWPAPAKGPVAIAVFGLDPFGEILDRTVQGKTIDGRPVVVRRITSPQALRSCRIVFISAAEKRSLRSILSAVEGAAILTVGEFEGFLDGGGGVNFTVEESRVRFDVNLTAARQSGLRISARLLHLARRVKE